MAHRPAPPGRELPLLCLSHVRCMLACPKLHVRTHNHSEFVPPKKRNKMRNFPRRIYILYMSSSPCHVQQRTSKPIPPMHHTCTVRNALVRRLQQLRHPPTSFVKSPLPDAQKTKRLPSLVFEFVGELCFSLFSQLTILTVQLYDVLY